MWCEGGEGDPWAWPGLCKADPKPHAGPLACVWRALLVGWPAYPSSILCLSSLPTSVQSLSGLVNLHQIKLLPVQKLPWLPTA